MGQERSSYFLTLLKKISRCRSNSNPSWLQTIEIVGRFQYA